MFVNQTLRPIIVAWRCVVVLLIDSDALNRNHLQSMSQPRPSLDPLSVPPDNALYEQERVHKVYESIAPHFSATRFKVVS